MATSSMDPDYNPEPDRQLGKGHGNKALGPGDTSDSGSDVQGGLMGIDEPDLGLDLDRGTTGDPVTRNVEASDENTDSAGTGEDPTAGREDDIRLNADIGTDRIDRLNPEEQASPDAPETDLPPPRRPGTRAGVRR